MRSHIRGLAAALIAAAALHGAPAFATPPAGYTLEWSDQFNQGVGLSPSASYWGFDTGSGGFGNNELETYTTDNAHSHIVADANAEDGNALQILTTDDNGGVGTAGQYTSARLNSSGKVMPEYGYVEARIQMPYGQGIWPAFWELGWNIGSVGWPACGEQDIMENIGNQSWWGINQGSLHGPGYSGGNALHAQYFLPTGQYFYQGYHKFAELWTPTSITYYVDDIPYETHTPADTNGNAWAFTGPAFLLANVAVGGNFPGSPDATTVFPQKMLIDYVKVYSAPFNGPHYAPGVVQAEDFDNGGQAISYSTTTNTNTGGQYRPELGVGIEATTGGGYDVGWTGAGQWMKYAVNVQTSGTYNVVLRVSSGATGGTLHIENESGTNLTGTITVPGTGGYQTWTTVHATAALTAGAHILKLVEDSGGYNVDYIALTSAAGDFGGPHNLPGIVEAEDYNQGGEGAGFHSLTTTANPAGVYRADPVTVENCTSGGYDVSSTAAGQWLKYGVTVSTAGQYVAAFRVASSAGGGKFHVADELGTNLTGTVNVPSTGGGQTWTVVNAIVNLPAGAHTLQLVEDTGGFSIDKMTFSLAFNGPHVVPGTVQAADYDQGGEGLAYHMMSPFSPGTSNYRGSDAVGIETNSLNGYDVGWTQAGQWLNYTVDAMLAGTYTATFTVASGTTGGTFHLVDQNGNNLTGTVTAPATGGWQAWQTVSASITLPAGGQVLQLVQDSGGFNFASMQLSNGSTTAASSVGVNPASVAGGTSTTATVTLTSAAVQSIGPDGSTVLNGQAVLLASDNAAATVATGADIMSVGGSTYVVVAAGQTTATFTVHTTAVGSTTTANISATLGVTQSTPLTIMAPPLPPGGVKATAGDTTVSLTWNASAGATSYSVYKGTTPGGESAVAAASNVATLSYKVTGLTDGITYYFTLKAVGAGGTSAASTEVSATPKVALPAAPTGLTVTAGVDEAALQWTAATGASTYDVYRGTTAAGEATIPIATGLTSPAYAATGLTAGTRYYFKVAGVNAGGTGPASNEASAVPTLTLTYAAGVRFISSPEDFSSTPPGTVFNASGVKLAVWSPSAFTYALTPTAPADHIRVGTGYWVKLPAEVTVTATGTPADNTQNFQIPLAAGWNQIGDPWFGSVALTSLTVNGTAFATASSGANPLVSPTVYGFSGTAYVATVSLAPLSGYWVYANSACTLSVPHP